METHLRFAAWNRYESEGILHRNARANGNRDVYGRPAQLDNQRRTLCDRPSNYGSNTLDRLAAASKHIAEARTLLDDAGCHLSAAKLADAAEYLEITIMHSIAARTES
jgi:hypothetical protein